MTQEEILNNYNQICRLIENRQIKDTLDKIESLVYSLLVWQLVDRAKELNDTYQWMLNYSVEGVNDPEQSKIYNSLIANCYKLIEDVKEELLSINSHNYVYSQKRFFQHTRKTYPHGLAFELESAEANAQLPEIIEKNLNAQGKKVEYAKQHEELTAQLFKQCWLGSQYSVEEFDLFKSTLENENISVSDKCLAISALNISLLRYFDEERCILLLDQCMHPNEDIAQRALVGLLPILAKYDARLSLFPHIRNRFVLLADNSRIKEHLKVIILQFARTNETEKITKKLKEEILPEMMKVAPKIREKIDMDKLTNNEEEHDDRNPEWQEILENSGVADKLKEFSDLQMEGSDVYMSTFAMLKNFSFFHEISNWFRPFKANQSDICELFEEDNNTFLSAMMGNSYMCNSDRYSFCLSLMQMPAQQRSMMSKAFTSEAEQIHEMQKEDNILLKGKQAEFISNAYIQDLYRFYKLFSYKDDFENPFAYSLKLHHTWFFKLIDFNKEELRQIAEYYFSKNFFNQALELFRKLEADLKTADIYQKIGYCYQQKSEYQLALQNYLQAEIIQPNNKWSIRKIAYCYRMLNDCTKALEYYHKAEDASPNNTNILVQIANCYLNLKEYDKALAYYFKIEYSSVDNIKMWRAIAWTSFLCNKLEQAIKFYEKIIGAEAQWVDYLNMAHVHWAQNDRKQAVNLYKQALQKNGKDLDSFIKSFSEDKHFLIQKGIDITEIAIVLDYIRYYAKNN